MYLFANDIIICHFNILYARMRRQNALNDENCFSIKYKRLFIMKLTKVLLRCARVRRRRKVIFLLRRKENRKENYFLIFACNSMSRI